VPLSETGLREDLRRAMLAKDDLRTRVLRTTLAAIKNKSIEARTKELAEPELVAVIKREARQCGETLDFARKAGRADTIREQEAILAILEGYLPALLGELELKDAIQRIVAETGATAIGAIMKELGARFPGRFDGKAASRIAADVLRG
jgi:uncharacterized protein YqeY